MKQETLEEFALKIAQMLGTKDSFEYVKMGCELGAKWQQERSYSEEDMIEAFDMGTVNQLNFTNKKLYQNAIEWFDKYKKK